MTTLCRGLIDALPQRLGDSASRRATSEPDRTAAWGDPPITLACGVAAPTGTLVPLVIDDLRLSTDRQGGRVLWSTTDRAITVQLDIPLTYDSQAEIVIPLVPALKQLPQR